MKANFKRITNCRACGSTDLVAYLDLASSPPANGLLNFGASDPERIEVMMMLCRGCFLSQLSVVVDPETMYRDYVYHSSISKTFQNHCRALAVHLRESFEFLNGWQSVIDRPRLMDIASNDGCLMREFKAEGFDVLGYEPCYELADKSQKEGLPTVCAFFRDLGSPEGFSEQKDVVTATNVLAHVDDLLGFVRGVKNYLEPGRGIFVAEVPHMLEIVDNNQFDTIYHEHLSYFLLRPLIGLYKLAGLEIFHVERLAIHGGSLRIYAANPGTREVRQSVAMCLADEAAGGMYDPQTYKEFSNWIVRLGADLRTVLDFTRLNGLKVMGYGAAAKGISLTNYLGIGKYIHSIVDETPAKQGKITPGERIPIVDFDAFAAERPDYIILFPWNFKDELISKTKHLGARYIVPIPEPKIVIPGGWKPAEKEVAA